MSINLSNINIEKEKKSTNLTETNIELQLGDVIRFKDPTNEMLNDHVFLIDYIDSEKIKLIDEQDLQPIQLRINNGVISNGTITEIELLSRNEFPGYAKQNGLYPGEWINLYFGGDLPVLITGEITNLEEDMIEIKTYPDGDTIYINFDYKGIPESIPIETIELRDPPQKNVSLEKNIGQQEEPIDARHEINEEEAVELGESISLDDFEPRVTINKKDKLRQMIVEADQIEFGDYAEAIHEYVDIDKQNYRYNIETQTNDLLNELLSDIPNNQRTSTVLNNIHIMITRFIQLRNITSKFDKNKNIIDVITKTASDKPLADYLSQFKNKLYWILMVAQTKKKVYDTSTVVNLEEDLSDTIPLQTTESIQEIKQLFNNYRSNTSATENNKYIELYRGLNNPMTPFTSVSPDINNHVICEHDVMSDMNVIIDNLGQLYSSVAVNSNILSRRFVIQKYNLGLSRLEATNLKGSKMIAHRVKLTNNDPISINSILTLPEPTIRFSQINLPGSNLLTKSNLHLHFLNYWQLLKKNTKVTNIEIDTLNTELEYDETNFLDNIKQFMLNINENEVTNTNTNTNTKINNIDIYNQFLKIIIPKIRVLFNLSKKYIKGKLSMVDLISYMEPFLIYSNDLTYMQYKEINKFIHTKISEYNRNYVENSRKMSLLKNMQSTIKPNTTLFDILNQNNDVKNIVFDKYEHSDSSDITSLLTNSELLKKITMADFGNLYNTAVAFENLHLMFPNELNSVFNMDKDKLQGVLEKSQQENTCKNYIIAKKYQSKEQVLGDNGQDIYFDKQYDNTPYGLLENFLVEQSRLTPEEFAVFLSDKLQKKYKYSAYDAEYISESLINGYKKVVDGQYAVIFDPTMTMETPHYYVRKNHEWIEENSIDPELFVDQTDTLCLIQPQCLIKPTKSSEGTDDSCETLTLSKNTIVNNALKEIMSEFDKSYDISKEELSKKLKTFLEKYANLFDKLENIQSYRFYKYDKQKYKIGLEETDDTKVVVSPHIRLRDIILGQPDFIKVQNDIIKFANKFTRGYFENTPNITDGEMETPFWLYCKDTNTKLLPTFVYTLASVFIQMPGDYNNAMSNVIKLQGKLSEDGDSWVDKYSGFFIKAIDWDVEEGYEDGFRIQSRAVLEEDLGQTMTIASNKIKLLSPQSKMISNVIQSLSTFMGINMDSQSEFIISVVNNLLNDTNVLSKEPAYAKLMEEMAKKGKTIPEYNVVYHSTVLYLTLGMFLIAAQTSIPSIKTRKTFPGCVRSFGGFPLQGDGDNSGVLYLSCVAYKIKSQTNPWYVLSQVKGDKKEEKIANNIKNFTVKYLLPNIDVDQHIKDKINYLLVYPEEDIPEEHNIITWTNFLPPLRRFKIKQLQNISNGFLESLMKDIRMGSFGQNEKIMVIESKVIQYSMAIQEAIQKIVEKKDLLLKSAVHPYMDNACCNEKGVRELTVLQYFNKDNNEIEQFNSIVKTLSNIIHDIHLLTEAPIFLSSVNTKRFYPAVPITFNEETIYYAFIHYCKFNSLVPVPSDLMPLCNDKPEYINKNESIQESIRKLKRDGRNYSESSLLRLLQIVSRNNIVNTDISFHTYTCIQRMRDLLDTTNDTQLPSKFITLMKRILDTYDISITSDTDDMRELKNYLSDSNAYMRKQLIRFIKEKGEIRKSEYNNINEFVTTITEWKFNDITNTRESQKQQPKDSRNETSISDSGMYNFMQYFKTFITMISKVYPTMILNQQSHNIVPPKYWGLSQRHVKDVVNIVDLCYEPIKKLYGNQTIYNVLKTIQDKTNSIVALANETFAFSEIKIDDKTMYSVLDKRIITLLMEYYLLKIFSSYIELTNSSLMLNRSSPDVETDDLERDDFYELTESMVKGNINSLKINTAKLLVGYMKVMSNTKDTINVSYDDIMDKVFKLKEKEKDTFTDRLQALTDEERNVDTILKINKLGVWNRGLTKGLKEYDPENYDQEREIMTKIAEIERQVRRQNANVDETNLDIYMDDYIEQMENDADIDRENNDMSYMNDDYLDGDYYGDEQENLQDYD